MYDAIISTTSWYLRVLLLLGVVVTGNTLNHRSMRYSFLENHWGAYTATTDWKGTKIFSFPLFTSSCLWSLYSVQAPQLAQAVCEIKPAERIVLPNLSMFQAYWVGWWPFCPNFLYTFVNLSLSASCFMLRSSSNISHWNHCLRLAGLKVYLGSWVIGFGLRARAKILIFFYFDHLGGLCTWIFVLPHGNLNSKT